jgi:murein hydrolase activator
VRLSRALLLLALFPAAVQAETRTAAEQDLALHRKAEEDAHLRQRAAAARAAALAQQQVQAAAALRQLEDQTGQDTQRLASLQAQQATAAGQLQSGEAALTKLLPVMERLEAAPAATLLAAPQSPSDAVRGIAILQTLAATIEAQAAEVKTQSARLAALLAQAQAAQTSLVAAAATQANAERALSAEIAAAQGEEMADSDAAAREAQATLLAQHQLASIANAVARLVPASPGAAPGLPAAPGAALGLPTGAGAPVAGRIVQNFGASTLAGPATGISYGAVPGARVVSPCAGTVMFAGAFPAYGHMVIADCGHGTSVVLAGMEHLDVATGERLAHGQPVGAMLGFDAADPTRRPILYVELRQNGTPVNPTSFLAAGGSG